MKSAISDWQVLVVDNSPTMGRMIKNQLVSIGLKPENITLARDGNQAFMITELKEFDLITSAMHLKWKDGLQLLGALRNSQEESMSRLPFLMISSDGSPQVIADLMSGRGNGFLKKPFQREDLKQTLEEFSANDGQSFVQVVEKEKRDQILKERDSEDSDQGIAPGIVEAFVESTMESLGQYMVNAVPGQCLNGEPLEGDLYSWIDIVDPTVGVKIRVLLVFPRKAACTIYETLFGEVDLDMVCGIVGELGNIIAGSVKPKLVGWEGSLRRLVTSDEGSGDSSPELDLQLGFPEAYWQGETEVPISGEAPAFSVPFQMEEEEIMLQVQFYPA